MYGKQQEMLEYKLPPVDKTQGRFELCFNRRGQKWQNDFKRSGQKIRYFLCQSKTDRKAGGK